MKIINRWTGAVIYEDDAERMRDTVLNAIAAGAVLTGADLTDAVLTGAVLTDAVLRGADLRGADLRGAVLRGADLRGADLRGAVLTDAVGIRAPIIEQIDAKILEAINQAGCKLAMARWHSCETTHCRAGWAIHLAGTPGYMLEDRIGPAAAGALIYAASRPGKPVPNFYADDDVALADIKACAAEQLAAASS